MDFTGGAAGRLSSAGGAFWGASWSGGAVYLCWPAGSKCGGGSLYGAMTVPTMPNFFTASGGASSAGAAAAGGASP